MKARISLFILSLVVIVSATFGLTVRATVTQRDVLIKASGDAVYYLASDGKRYVFPNQRVYESWFSDFEGVIEITDEDLASFMIGGNITYRPGIRMVKITTDPKVYAVGRGGVLRWVSTEAIAVSLYGTNWNQWIDDVPDAFFFNYTIGDLINSASDYSPTTQADGSQTINSDKSLPASIGALVANTSPPIQSDTSSGFKSEFDADFYLQIVGKVNCGNSWGSATLVDREGTTGVLYTNRHVVEGSTICTVYFSDSAYDAPTRSYLAVVSLVHPSSNDNADFAILEISNLPLNSPVLTDQAGFCSNAAPGFGDNVYVIGYPGVSNIDPEDLTLTITSGLISGFLDGGQVIKSDAFIDHGNSGGAAILESENCYLGLPTFGFPTTAGEEGLSGLVPLTSVYDPTTSSVILLPTPVSSTSDDPEPTPSSPSCTADTWSCGGWESCSESGSQTRSCWIVSDCAGVSTPNPSTIQSCTPTASCTEDTWSCGEWSACSEQGSQTRICTMTNDCSGVSTPTPDTEQSCTPPVPGTISVSLSPDDSETEAGVVIGQTSNAVLAKFTLTAQDEELKVTKIRLTVESPTGVSSLSLYDGATLVGGPATVEATGIANFNNMNFVVPKDGSKTLTAKGDLSPVGGSSGVASGLPVTVTLDHDDNFEVRGTGSGSNTLITDVGTSDVAGNTKILRKTKPTISLVALPTSTLITGDIVSLRFTVSADAAEAVSLKKLTATVIPSLTAETGAVWTVATTADSSVRRVGDSTNLAGSAAIDGDVNTNVCKNTSTGGGDMDATCTVTLSFTSEEVIAAGTSRTYDLRLNLTASLATGHSLTASLISDSATATGWLSTEGAAPDLFLDTTNDSSANGADQNFIWSDNSAVPHNSTEAAGTGAFTSSGDWMTGFYAKVLPTDTQTMSK